MKRAVVAVVKDRTAHRGYSIIKSLPVDIWYVSKDGFYIQSAPGLDAAKRVIDALLEGEKS